MTEMMSCFTCGKKLKCICDPYQSNGDKKCFERMIDGKVYFPRLECLIYFGDILYVHYCSEGCKKTIYSEIGYNYTYNPKGYTESEKISECDYSKMRPYKTINGITGEEVIIDKRRSKIPWIVMFTFMTTIFLIGALLLMKK